MKKKFVLASLFAIKFLEISVFVTTTAMRHAETSMQIFVEVFKYLFVLKSNLIQANEWNRHSPISYPVKATALFRHSKWCLNFIDYVC